MKLPHRRRFLHLAAGAAALQAAPRTARAQAYPVKPVRIIAPFAAGSSGDIHARLLGPWLSERLGQPFIVENRTGAGGTLGAEAVVRAAPDGYTLLLSASPDAITATLYEKLNYNFIRDTAPVASISRGPLVLVVHPSFPAKTIPEFVSHAKANPGKVTFASAGIGSIVHMAGELFKVATGVELVHVPYRGLGPAITDLIGGQVQAIFSTTPPAIAQVRADKLRALAVTSAKRSEAFPNIPSISETVPGYEATIWQGLQAPRNVPAQIVERLNKEVNAALADTGMTAKLADLGVAPAPMTTVEFGRFVVDETEKWGKVIRTANIKPE